MIMGRVVNVLKRFQNIWWLLVVLLIWEGVSRLGIVNSYILPSCSAVFRQLFLEVTQGNLGLQILNSLYIVFEGFLISFVLGIGISVLCIWSPVIESFFKAISNIMNPLPGMAILPLIMMWFGIGNGAMLILIVHGVLWPLITNFTVGFKSIPDVYVEWGKNIGLPPLQMMLHIHFFAIMPYFISGLRVGWGRAWRALISAEMVFGMIGTLGGIGYYIYQNRAYANMTNVMVGVVAITIIGIAMEQGVFRLIERSTIEKWGSTK